ncbi:hypothetical protein J2Y49_005544 [Azospirillum sp. BE72]|nr:hypothetical protein [Azospirillum sp. BE72]
MWQRTRVAIGRVVVSLLVLATLLAYAAPIQANAPSFSPAMGTLAQTSEQTTAALISVIVEDGHALCGDMDLTGGACCSSVQCVTMHGGLLPASFEPLAPLLVVSRPIPSLATPDGIGSDPALRPPL